MGGGGGGVEDDPTITWKKYAKLVGLPPDHAIEAPLALQGILCRLGLYGRLWHKTDRQHKIWGNACKRSNHILLSHKIGPLDANFGVRYVMSLYCGLINEMIHATFTSGGTILNE